MDELLAWVALHCAGVGPRFRHAVCARGVHAVHADGFVEDHARRVVFDSARHVERAARLFGWPWGGGRVLGGCDLASMGVWGTRKPAPLCAYVRGDLALTAARPSVALVGPREPSDRALRIARKVAHAVAEAGGTIVSGGARGVDRAAHEAAIEAGGRTIAVLGDPLRPHTDERRDWMRRLFDAHADRAISVCPYGPWVPGSAFLFAARNVHIAALAEAVLVVEGGADSGTGHTARHALNLRIPLWAVVGDSACSALPNSLVDAGRARPLNLLRAVEQLIPGASASAAPAAAPPPLPDDPLLRLLAQRGRTRPDEAAAALGWTTRQLLVEAAVHELEGRLHREGPWLVTPPVPP